MWMAIKTLSRLKLMVSLVPENFSEIELADAMLRAYRLLATDTLPDNLLPVHCRQADQMQSLLKIVARADEPI